MGSNFLSGMTGLRRRELEEGGLFKVDFETVPYLVKNRKAFIKSGKAYLPGMGRSIRNASNNCTHKVRLISVTISEGETASADHEL